mgnify:FL=1
MFKKLAAEALGLSDIGVIVARQDYDKVDADDYLFHEDNEQIVFLIKSKKDEYCFTNLALIHVDGDSAVSSKRKIVRYEYASHRIGYVGIETAGTMDMDVELKFSIGDQHFSIDIRKDFIEALKDIYKALTRIGQLQYQDELGRHHALQTLGAVSSMYRASQSPTPEQVVATYDAVLKNLNETVMVRHTRRDFAEVFERYIRG